MRVVDLIRKKRDGGQLTHEEIAFLVNGYTQGRIADYQMSAFLMAVFFRGMSAAETVSLTHEMIHSGIVVDLSELPGRKIDKHSTGGVGDKTSLILAPLAAAAGVWVPMVSGRGLGHTGGTLDKLESIPGFRVGLTLDEYKHVLKTTGLVLIGATKEIAPADKKIYALRDVTATVESIPLITASILSKKVAEGIDGLVMDVKFGNGAFMKSFEQARQLAQSLASVGRGLGLDVRVLLTDMSQPLGQAVGNALEVIECIEVLKGRGPADLKQLSVELAAHMVVLGQKAASLDEARRLMKQQISNGAGLEKLRAVIAAQGGDPLVVDDYARMPQAAYRAEVVASVDGFVADINAETIGLAAMQLGAGRELIDSLIDPAVGIVLHKKVGDQVQVGQPLATIYYNAAEKMEQARRMVIEAYSYSDAPPAPRPLVAETF
ncbi:MAG: thymidine phosphorylase [Acidobacteriota bacterium]|nr:thymidine phosphorylase [Blastocatellia bacterium]MDW8238635.1 thymidine phosphorylase [Acidobacteriota bacterium]